jgi:hypothetical protein
MYVVYDHPKDFPDYFVVRRHVVKNGEARASLACKYFDTLEQARLSVPDGRVCITRHPDDDPAILETWI